MKVTIKDVDALKMIDPVSLVDYVALNGWEDNGSIMRQEVDIGIEFKKWSNDHHRYFYVNVITDMELADYPSRMAENLYAIECQTGESQLTIYAKITKQVIVFDGIGDLVEESENDESISE